MRTCAACGCTRGTEGFIARQLTHTVVARHTPMKTTMSVTELR